MEPNPWLSALELPREHRLDELSPRGVLISLLLGLSVLIMYKCTLANTAFLRLDYLVDNAVIIRVQM